MADDKTAVQEAQEPTFEDGTSPSDYGFDVTPEPPEPEEGAGQDDLLKKEPTEEGGSEEPKGEEKTEEKEDSGIEFEFDDEKKEEKKEEPEPKQETKPDPNEILLTSTEGKVKSTEELKALLTEVEELRTKTKQPEYKHTLAKSVDEYIEKGGKASDFFKYLSVEPDTMEPLDALITAEMWETPDLSESDLKSLLEDEYHLYDEEDDRYDENEARNGRIKMKRDAAKAKARIKEIQDQHRQPEQPKEEGPTKEDLEKKAQERADSFEPVIERLTKGFEKAMITLPGSNAKMKFDVDPKAASEMKDVLMNMVRQRPDIPLSEQGIDQLRTTMQAIYVAQNTGSMIEKAMNQARNMTDETWQKVKNNPSGLSDKGEPHVSKEEKEVDPYDALFEERMAETQLR